MQVVMKRDASGFMVRWSDELAARAHAEGAWPDRTVAQFAQDRYLARPDRVQLVDNDRALTCRQLYQGALKLAGYYRAAGLKAGDVVSFQLPNWWEAQLVNLAGAMTGVVVNPIVPIYRDAEVSYMLDTVGAKIVFIPDSFRNFDYAAMMRRILPDMVARPAVVVVRGQSKDHGFDGFERIVETASPVAGPDAVDPDAVKMVMFTSGTTGRSKGVLHSHNSIHADGMKMAPALGLDDRDCTFSPSPITHVSGYLWALNIPWLTDIPAVTVDVWDPQVAFDTVRRHGCSFMLGATPFLQGLLDVVRERGETLPGLRQYLCGGAAVPPSLIYDAMALLPNVIAWRNFGATEVPTMTRAPERREDALFGAETDGRIHYCDVKIIDLVSGEPVSAGQEGEICAREASMALGYLNSEDNADAYDDEGYFHMGDIGMLVHGDHIVVTGRKKDLIIRAGENISAKEIEDVLLADAQIADAAVVSMPSAKTGEAICAFIVPEGDARPDMGYVTALVAAAGLAKQKTPEYVALSPELPRTASGKIRKDVLRDQARAFTLSAR